MKQMTNTLSAELDGRLAALPADERDRITRLLEYQVGLAERRQRRRRRARVVSAPPSARWVSVPADVLEPAYGLGERPRDPISPLERKLERFARLGQ